VIGQTISHYKILEKLGEGGMGVVYKAQDTKLNRVVALKFLPQRTEIDARDNARLLQEARAAGQLNHPNIATIYDFETVGDRSGVVHTFMAMEYVEGQNLKSVIDLGAMAIENVRSVAMQLAQGLAAAHEKKVIHRDLKPGNIIFTQDGSIKILDFGVAKLLGETEASSTGKITGTVAYMSPEQLQGGAIDERSDIWAYGVVLFETLSGVHPFHGEHIPSLMYSIVSANPLSLATFRPEVPSDLQRICEQCLQKDPANRPQSMQEIIDALHERQLATKWTLSLTRIPTKVFLGLVSIVLMAVAVWIVQRSLLPSDTRSSLLRIGILPFQQLTPQRDSADWPVALQTMFAQEITGVDGLSVPDPFSLNSSLNNSLGSVKPERNSELYDLLLSTNIAYVVDGSILKSTAGCRIQCSITKVATRELVMSCDTTVSTDGAIPFAVRTLSHHVVNYFHMQVLSFPHAIDLRPWLKPHGQSTEAVKAFIQAYRLSFNGIPGAERLLLRAIQQDSTFVIPRIWLAFGYSRAGKITEATLQRNALLRLEPHASPLDQALIRWADAVYNRDTLAQMRHLQSALDYSPENNVLLAQLAQIQYSLGDYHGALETLKPAVEMNWAYSPAYVLVATCMDSLKDYGGERAILEKALALAHSVPDAYAMLSRLEYRTGDTVRARECESLYVRSVISSGTRPVQPYLQLAQRAFASGLYSVGLENAKRAMTADPTHPRAHEAVANGLFYAGDLKSAELGYRVAIQLDSTLVDSHVMLGLLLERAGDHRNAMYHYRISLGLDSTSLRANTIRARLATSR